MRTSTKITLGAVFTLTLCAGVVAGVLAARLPAANAPSTSPEQTVGLAEELQLNSEQRDKMRQIWEGVRDTSRQCLAEAQSAEQEREDKIMALLSEDQKTKYAAIMKGYTDRSASLKVRRDAAFQKAVEQTRQILSEPQRQRYERILRARIGNVTGHGPLNDTPAL